MYRAKHHNLNHRVSGNGRPVVFLHGFLESISMWDYLGSFDGMQCIFIDLPGHGKSDLNEYIELSMISIAESIIDLLEQMGIKSYDVVGHSMGGYVSLELKRLDSACDKVILMNSNFWADSALKKEDRKRIAKLVKTKKAAFINTAIPSLFIDPDKQFTEVDNLIKEAIFISVETVANSSIAMSLRNDNTKVVKENVEDVLVVQGVLDSVVNQQMMHEKIKGMDVSLCELPCGHMAHIECSDSLKKEMLSFLTKKTETTSFRYR